MNSEAESDFDVGARLKEVRTRVGLSQRALAERAGVPHGQISFVETNRNSPSIASLRKILSGVPITMSEFFEPDRSRDASVFFESSELVELTGQMSHGSASISIRQVGEAWLHNLQILHERYAPGADTGASMLEHVGHEGGIVMSGSLEVTIGAQKKILGPGDAYIFDSKTPHRFRNIGQTEAVIISACSPPYL